MIYRIVPVTPFQQNCSIIGCKTTGQAAIIDPGGDLDKITACLEESQLTAQRILLTHGHIDHAGRANHLAEQLDLPIWGPHKADAFWLEQLPMQSQLFGFEPHDNFSPDRWLEDGDEIIVGDLRLSVLHCPGHTPGHVVFIEKTHRLAIVGDVIFKGSIGRTDFPQGNQEQLLNSITQKLFLEGDDIRFIPGHGPMSDFGTEKLSNPFVASRFR
ncbi:MAG: MBL fold metallo-hydrolase [Pseudomonadota bacterium]